MAQVGRISGPLLEANLLRQGIANGTQQNLSFKNTNTDTTLLKVDVANGRIGVDLEAPANELHISQTTQTTDLIADTANIGNFDMSTNNINVNSGDLYLNAAEAIVLSNLETEQFYVSDNYISTKDTNTDIELKLHGTGIVEIQSNLKTLGDIYTPGNITFDGSITFGDSDQDSVDFNADLVDSLIPDITDTYNFGSQQKRWNQLNVVDVYGQLINTGQVNVDGMSLDSRQGNIFYVAKEGNDSNVGDHPNGALLTIQEAIARCDASTSGPVTIYVYPGEYEEQLPLVLPEEVSVVGVDIRNTVIKPASGYESKDVFHLDDSCVVSDITIKDFYYDSGNDVGYAFRFSPGASISKRSPYIQGVTVITAGSVTSASDPRGFDEGDAGKGAMIDADDLDAASPEKSMLFHSATFITPGVDCITMTNGVRVEWLNSFTYFANRGLYATNGSGTGNGAELRSIGSANVYGNYGAVADGNNTLMYLVQHNMGYIGAGKYLDNDASRAIYANEIEELNNGVIHYTTTDHLGGFRVGDNFWIDFETGNTTVNIDTLTVNQFTGLIVNTGSDTTVIDGAYIETGNLTIASNVIESNTGDLNLASATGTINLQDNTNVTGNVAISGDLSYDGVLNISGDEETDRLVFNTEFEQDFNPNLHQTYDLGSFEKKWLIAHLDRVEAGDMSFYDNVIETNLSNADLELRANGTGKIRVSDNATFSNALTVNGTTTVNNGVDITDPTLTITGDITQTGSTSTSEDFDVGENLNVGASAEFEEILVDDNFITTTTSNADLELRASGTGIVNLQTNVNVDNNLSANDVDTTNVTVTLNTTSNNANIGDVEINDNYIETTNLNSNLVLGADRAVFVKGTDTIFGQNLSVSGQTNLNSDVTVTGTITHVDDTRQTGNVTLNGEWTNSNIYIEDNYISTVQSNSDLELRASGTGKIVVPTNNFNITNNLSVLGLSLLDNSVNNTGTITKNSNYIQTGNYTINGELTVDNVYVEDNFITTTTGNLTLQAAGTGTIFASSNNVVIDNDLAVDGVTDLDDTTINGTIAHTGNYTQTGNYDIAGELTVDNVYVEDNFITTTTGNLTLGATGNINVDTNDVEIAQDLTVSGATSLQGTSITGTVTHAGNRTQTGNLDIAGEITNGNILIEDNFISTTNSNSDLELRASGTGEVVIDGSDTVTVNNNLFVGGTLIYQGFLTINGDVTLQGNLQDGSLTVTENFDVSGTLDIGSQAQFEDIRIEDNFITTTLSNSNLELRASGTGNIVLQENVQVNNNLTADNVYSTSGNLNISQNTSANAFIVNDINFSNNYIETTSLNTDLELRASGTGNVNFESLNVTNNVTTNGTTNLRNVSATNITQTGNKVQTGDLSLIGDLSISDSATISSYVQSTDIKVSGNVIETITNNTDLDLRAAGTGTVDLQENVQVNNNLFAASISTTDIVVNNDLVLNEIIIPPSVIEIDDNFISTKESNANLELRASGTGNIVLQENVIAEQNFNINNNTNLQNTNINGSVTHSGNRTQIGNYNLTGNLNLSGLVTDREFQFDDIRISGNVLETTLSNSNLDLRAAGSGKVLLQENVLIPKNITTGSLTIDSITVEDSVSLETIELSTDVQFSDNTITTTNSNSNLELRANGIGYVQAQEVAFIDSTIASDPIDSSVLSLTLETDNVIVDGSGALLLPVGDSLQKQDNTGDLRFNTDLGLFQGTTTGTVTFGGVFSADTLTSVSADPYSNNIRMVVNGNFDDSTNLVGEVTGSGLRIHGIQVEDISINNNEIKTTESNSNLELRPNGSGSSNINDTIFTDNIIKDSGNNLVIRNTGFGKTKFAGTYGIVVPSGATSERPANLGQPDPEIGDTRWNTTTEILETWDGNQYLSAAGISAAITPQEFDDLLLEYTLIFG